VCGRRGKTKPGRGGRERKNAQPITHAEFTCSFESAGRATHVRTDGEDGEGGDKTGVNHCTGVDGTTYKKLERGRRRGKGVSRGA